VNWGDHVLTVNDKKLKATGGYFEKEMPEMFTLKNVARKPKQSE
jgi:putative ABC transport system permease protein